MSDESNDDWFNNMENLKPVRGGRRAATLNSVAKNALHATNQEAEAKFRADWELAKQSEDPLDILWHYSVWFDEHFPSGKPQLFYPMLYKICTYYGLDERYQHDERLLKFWIMLAENFPERGLAVFDFAYNRGSCKTMAKFYVRWSEMYDTMGNSNKARDMLNLGLRNRAVPITVIHEASNKLEMRLMRDTIRQRKTMNGSDNFEEQEMDHGDDDNYGFTPCAPRKQLAKLTGIGENNEAPMFRVPKGPAGVLKLPQSSTNASFEIFEDEPDVPQAPAFETPIKKTGRIAEEFENDPDYQALFGFFDHHSRPNIHLNISENVRKSTKSFGLKDLPEIPAGDDFEIFTESSASNSSEDTRRNPLGDKKQDVVKTKLCLPKEICQNKLSMEEYYANIIKQHS